MRQPDVSVFQDWNRGEFNGDRDFYDLQEKIAETRKIVYLA